MFFYCAFWSYLQPKKSRKAAKKLVETNFMHESAESSLPLDVVGVTSALSRSSNLKQTLIVSPAQTNSDISSSECSSLVAGPYAKRRKIAAESKLTILLILPRVPEETILILLQQVVVRVNLRSH
jgi:hypothetical protein